MSFNKNQHVFFALVRAGLWEKQVLFSQYEAINYNEIYRIAQEQSLVGLVTAGIEHIEEFKVPQDVVLKFVGDTLQLEQRNALMNDFIVTLINKLRTEGVYTLLVKGQGIAQCYERPLWRASGDIDLFFSEHNYPKALQILSLKASKVDEELSYIKHIAMKISSFDVELHGSFRCGLWRTIDRELDELQYVIFNEGKVRSWLIGGTQVFLPHEDEDVVYVFSHILEHFFKEGIGLRQICDWCRLLWTFKDSLNYGLLESRIRKMGLMTEWKAFAAFAVDWLGMSVDAMPLYSDKKMWSRKAEKIMEFVLETGNFGYNRDYSYQLKYPFLVYKAVSFWLHIKDTCKYFTIFPLDSLKVLERKIYVGISVVLSGCK